MLAQPPCERHGSVFGTVVAQLAVRKRTRLRLYSPAKYPTLRSAGFCESPRSGKDKSEQLAPPQVAKLLRMAVNAAGPGTSGVPCASIMKVCPRGAHQMQRPPAFTVRL